MKKISLIILTLISIFGCKEVKEKVFNSFFDSSEMFMDYKYSYEYKSKKLISKTETILVFMRYLVVDTIKSKTFYEYNEKGLLQKETEKSIDNEIYSIKQYEYNSKDSLTLVYITRQDKDTTYIVKYDYYPDGRKIVFERYLFTHVDKGADFKTAIECKKFDTIFGRYEYEYKNQLCVFSKRYDIANQLVEIIEYEFENGNIKKKNVFGLFNSIKAIQSITYYDYSKSRSRPDSYTLNSENDTIALEKYYFKGAELKKSENYIVDKKEVIACFYNNGKKIGEIETRIKTRERFYYLHSYYNNGDLRETKSYREK
jgi:hypothetical protein